MNGKGKYAVITRVGEERNKIQICLRYSAGWLKESRDGGHQGVDVTIRYEVTFGAQSRSAMVAWRAIHLIGSCNPRLTSAAQIDFEDNPSS